jgi:hypothetical protein
VILRPRKKYDFFDYRGGLSRIYQPVRRKSQHLSACDKLRQIATNADNHNYLLVFRFTFVLSKIKNQKNGI